jgi:hypothetical protein
VPTAQRPAEGAEVTAHFRLRAQLLFMAGPALCTLWTAADAAAQSTIRTPGDRRPYTIEAEPHLALGLFGPPGDGSGGGWGAGGRASFEIVRNGFIESINNSVSIGVGADFLHYDGSGYVGPGRCTRFASAPGGAAVCVEVSQTGGPSNYLFLPAVLQWNFWLAPKWSVFGEPGIAIYVFDYDSAGVVPTLYLGGRFHFSDKVTLTLRVGYPTFSLGVSFLL